MKRFSPVISALAFAIATPAVADLTAQQVWDSWKSLSADMGQTVTVGGETFSAGALSLTDVGFAMTLPDGTIDTTVPEITFQEQGDGAVVVTMSPTYYMRVQMKPAFQDAWDTTVELSAPDLRTTASGSLEAIRYDIAGPELAIRIKDMRSNDTPVDLALSVIASDFAGTYEITPGATFEFDSAFTTANLTMDMVGNDLEDDGSGVTLSATYTGLSVENSGTGAGLFNMVDPMAIYAKGNVFRSGYSHDGGAFAIEMREEDSPLFNMTGTSTGGTLGADIVDGGIAYEGASSGLDVRVSGPIIPFPEVSAKMETFGFGLTMPMTVSETPQDIALLLNLSGLEVSDFIWAMIDSAATLPHDPATLLVRLTGQAKMLVNLTDPIASAGVDMPAELHALNIDELRLSIAGAELTGAGGFTFDNTDTTTFDGLPAPDGTVDLQLVGGNGLLDKLVQMGLVPQDQAMGARMIIGLFSTPSDPDTLNTQITVTPDGAISANGQRIQ